ncbi:hypothetical protein BDF20DRAFT_817082 [Mycotypha africana]|uniref:uncharacterized protein n=1 Tax=Mycotypha africana TaxID=64632 RepID=UPI0022FFE6CD|nr:uncharacterized protein BDF20DRAFT_817082 [Mycotypha africana]KAI8984369.1 hypothetical protein BDF20DRAFT_817082 [Mycotypha africana]
MAEAKALMNKKDEIEKQLRDLNESLESTGAGMSEPLIDNAGFPLAELDIHAIRINRNAAIRLRNDHRAVMSDVEKVLHKIHEANRRKRENDSQQNASLSTEKNELQNSKNTATVDLLNQQQQAITTPPFAIVNAVAPDSPAYEAGLRRNDKIVQFGHVNANNHDQLRALNTLVSTSENRQIPITIMRDSSSTVRLIVTPRSGWGGRGTLGCHILPL